MREPQILAVVVEGHLLFELLLSFVIAFVHDHGQFEGIVGQQDVAVLLDDHLDLVRLELGQEVHNEFFIVLQNYDPELLENVAEIHDLHFWRIDHGVEGVNFLDFGAQLILHDFSKDIDDAVVIDLLEISVVHALLLLLELHLPQQEIVLDVLFEHLLRQVCLELVLNDPRYLLEDTDELRHHDLLAAHCQPDFFLYRGNVSTGDQERVDVVYLSFA